MGGDHDPGSDFLAAASGTVAPDAPGADADAPPGHMSAGSDPLERLVDLTLAEAQTRRAGGDSIRLRLGELMFVEVVRRYLEGLPANRTGWLAGLRDPAIGRALALLHE